MYSVFLMHQHAKVIVNIFSVSSQYLGMEFLVILHVIHTGVEEISARLTYGPKLEE